VVAGAGSVVVPVTTYDLADNRGRGTIWQVEDPGSARALTPEKFNASKPSVSPDGKMICFLAGEEGQARQLHLLEVGGEPRPLAEFPLGALGAKWMPDGRGLVVLAPLLKAHLSLEGTAAELERRKSQKYLVHTTEDALYRYWDTWLTTGEVPHLFHLELGSGAITDLIPRSERWWAFANTDDPLADFDLSPDGKWVAFVADSSTPPHRQLKRSLFLVGIEVGEPLDLTPEGVAHAKRPRFSPDNQTVLFGFQVIPDFYGDRVRLGLLDLDPDRSWRPLTADWDRSVEDWEFDGRGDVVFAAEDRGYQHLFRLSGPEPELLAEGGTLASPTVDGEGTVFLLRHSFTRPPEVVRLAEGGELVAVTDFTRPATEELSWGRVEDMTVSGADGDPVQCFLVHPPAATPDRLPLIHMIHGGPHGMWGDGWQWRWHAQTLAAEGYLVAAVNFHGSSSFGQDFATSIHGAWGDKPYRDIEAVTDHLIGLGLVDEGRMAVAGGSYGGYLTAFITGQTDRYACAVAHAAVTNLEGMYASDVTTGRARAYGAEVWEDRAAVDRYSPSSHASGYRTPTLVVVGEKDYRVPATQGLELYGVLKAKEVPARLLYFPGENHWILQPQASLHWYQEVLAWLELHLHPDGPN
jgi:dipeptidyl aminopeptidase/acylaminoacyl peptidase